MCVKWYCNNCYVLCPSNVAMPVVLIFVNSLCSHALAQLWATKFNSLIVTSTCICCWPHSSQMFALTIVALTKAPFENKIFVKNEKGIGEPLI